MERYPRVRINKTQSPPRPPSPQKNTTKHQTNKQNQPKQEREGKPRSQKAILRAPTRLPLLPSFSCIDLRDMGTLGTWYSQPQSWEAASLTREGGRDRVYITIFPSEHGVQSCWSVSIHSIGLTTTGSGAAISMGTLWSRLLPDCPQFGILQIPRLKSPFPFLARVSRFALHNPRNPG